MKTPIKELIDSVGNMAQGLDADELYDYFMEKATQMLEKEKEDNKGLYIAGYLDNGYYEGAEDDAEKQFEKTYAFRYETFNTKEK